MSMNNINTIGLGAIKNSMRLDIAKGVFSKFKAQYEAALTPYAASPLVWGDKMIKDNMPDFINALNVSKEVERANKKAQQFGVDANGNKHNLGCVLLYTLKVAKSLQHGVLADEMRAATKYKFIISKLYPTEALKAFVVSDDVVQTYQVSAVLALELLREFVWYNDAKVATLNEAGAMEPVDAFSHACHCDQHPISFEDIESW